MTPIKWLAAVLGVVGLLALVVGILYFSIPAHSLPSFLGPLHIHTKAHRKRRGEAAIAIAIVLWVIAAVIIFVARRSSNPAPAATAPTGPGEAA